MIIILFGLDDFAVREALNQIRTECDDAMGMPNITRFDGKKVTPGELLDACNTFSMLASKRLVVVEGLLSRFETRGKKGKGKRKSPELVEWESLTMRPIPDSTTLVLIDGNLNRTNPLLRKLQPIAQVREYQPLDIKGKELPDWIRTRVSNNGADIMPRAISHLINLVGNNLWILSNEVDKLCNYADGQPIEEADVDLLVSNARELNVFRMVDLVVQRRKGEALKTLHQHLAEGAAPTYLLVMITAEFRLLIQAKTLKLKKVPIKDISGRLGESREWKLEKMLRQAEGYSLGRLKRTYQRLLEADLAIKTGTMDGEFALDLLITDLCQR